MIDKDININIVEEHKNLIGSLIYNIINNNKTNIKYKQIPKYIIIYLIIH